MCYWGVIFRYFSKLLEMCRNYMVLRHVNVLVFVTKHWISIVISWIIHSCHFADIQEFYELTLLDETKSVQQKTAETLQMANKWETNQGMITMNSTIRDRLIDVPSIGPGLGSCVTAFFPRDVSNWISSIDICQQKFLLKYFVLVLLLIIQH